MSNPFEKNSSIPPKRAGGRTSRSQRIRARTEQEEGPQEPTPFQRSEQVGGSNPTTPRMPALRRVRCSNNIEARSKPAPQRSPLDVPEASPSNKASARQHLVSVTPSSLGVAGPRAA